VAQPLMVTAEVKKQKKVIYYIPLSKTLLLDGLTKTYY
jgi:hypothetical protein